VELGYATIWLEPTVIVTIEIQHQLQMQYDDLKLQTLIKVSPFPSKVYDNGCLLNNTKCTHLKGEKS
jgi:hypothetical protein